ncbi:MAG: flippase-like domain-containing protein [Solirubrobacterales bacterium]|nr:flippase-like domain-containing protein [Solirubrobacterales bacterium]
MRQPAQKLAGRRRRRSAIDRRRLLTVLVLAACLITVLLAVPDLRPVAGEIADMNPALVAAALGLELASCLSFVVIFRLFFKPLPGTLAREMAWSQLGSGALLPGGGVGSLAVGGWLLHLAGMSAQQIVRRSSGLFFLTSAINVFTLAASGLLLLLGITDGPHDMLRAGLPVIAALAAIILVLGLPNLTRRASSKHPKAAWLEDIGTGIPAARHALARPSWRLLGALGYLLFDIAVLWTTFAAVGPLPPLAPLILAYLAGYLANAIPIPGGIGVLDSGLVGALTLYGLPVTHAAAAVLVYHAIAFWIPTLGGTLAYARLRPRLVIIDNREIAPPRQDRVGVPTPSTDDVQNRPIAA